MHAATSVYDEQDGDFLFTRGSKRAKTAPEPEVEVIESPTIAAPVKKSAGRPPKSSSSGSSTRRRASPPPHPPVAQPKAAALTTTRISKRKSGLTTTATAAAQQQEELVVPKTRGRRKVRESVERRIEEEEEPQDEAPPPRKSTRANGTRTSKTRIEEVSDESLSLVEGTPIERRDGNSGSQQISLPFSDTPIINRNKEMRKKGGANGSRRSSLGMRGRRASSLIDNGHNALPHREVDPAEFYKHISAEGLSEPRRMKQLLIWCGERALSEKPPHGSHGSSAVLGGKSLSIAHYLDKADLNAQLVRYKTSFLRISGQDRSSQIGFPERRNLSAR